MSRPTNYKMHEFRRLVAEADLHLSGTCPLVEDEAIVWADKRIIELENEIEELKGIMMMKWINADKELPENDTQIIGCCDDDVFIAAEQVVNTLETYHQAIAQLEAQIDYYELRILKLKDNICYYT